MHTYKVSVTRDGKWWMVDVPELDGYVSADGTVNVGSLTQARRLSEVSSQAVDYICTVTDQRRSEVAVDVRVTVDGIDVTAEAKRLTEERRLADQHAAAARDCAENLARELAAHGVAVRDVGDVLGVSFQRAQQLISR
ncbi:MAG TPA: HicB family toxin-antitoxin system [Mycobacterium sp.]|nr:HicB family toxin-antitoxin system [Mycobacterium sp.]HQC76560.1 HicB family toxin-antitoxin system [Mycobacterium sp.]